MRSVFSTLMLLRTQCSARAEANIVRDHLILPMGDNFSQSYHTPRASFIFRIRQVLSHVTDICSEYSRFIAPAYHHDRCERSVQMKLYNFSKSEFCLTFISFFSVLGLCALLGLAGPAMTITVEEHASQLFPDLNQTQLAAGPFLVKSPALSPYHHQLWLITTTLLDNRKDQSFEKWFQLSVSIQGVPTDHAASTPLSELPHNRSRQLVCSPTGCAPLTILHLSHLRHTHLIVLMRFHGLEDMVTWTKGRDVVFYYKTYNPSFTKLEIWVRFIFLLVVFLAACWFDHSLRKYPITDWAIEQKWLSVLLPLLILYNNPLYPLQFLVDSFLPSFLDSLFQCTFLAALLLFWLCIYHALRQNERKLLSFYMPKVAIVGSQRVSALVAATLQRQHERHHPLYSAPADINHFYTFKICVFTAGAVYILYLLYLIIRAYTDLRAMPFFDVRLRFSSYLLVCVVCVLLGVTAARFGLGVIENNFGADPSTKYCSSVQFLSFYGLVNVYLLTMAYVYSPSDRALLEGPVLRDSPSLSMGIDSDEEVVYGSDDDTRIPLTRPQRPNEDSD